MKVLFTAVGSIGSRHIGNLIEICQDMGIKVDIDVVRKSHRVLSDNLKALINKEIWDETEIAEYYDVVFITDETKSHYENIIKYRDRCSHMFIEKPVLDDIGYDISVIEPKQGSEYYVACPIRHSRYYEELMKVVKREDVYSVRIIFSSYMPNWQKGRDYRNSFRCFMNRGGGVDIDSLHEIDYMTSLFGFPKRTFRVAGQYSNLVMDAPDLATYIFEYKDMLIEMHLDYFGRTNNRRVEFYTKNDVVIVDYNKHIVEHQLLGEIEDFGVDDRFYQKEMKYFITLINSNGMVENINPISNAIKSLKLAKGYND
ncbi:hypothetical protein BXO88_09105 [Oribacterium sp. C9]|nr:hypothetical protein BXO88_09105 [Oribacterium sp. C9]